MRKQSPTAGRNPRPLARARVLGGALLVFGGLLVFANSCGSDDLVFPGNAPPTPVATETPTDEN
jgi:hypothetical protein